MFSNLSPNSILYILDYNSTPKVISGPIEKVSIPRPKYTNFNPTMESVVDIVAVLKGERREFKGVPNSSIADFGNEQFILAESKEALNSYVSSMLQNSKSIIESVDKHTKLVPIYEEALQDLNPDLKALAEKDKVINTLQDQVATLQAGMEKILAIMTKDETSKEM